jgi:hypothetical protein
MYTKKDGSYDITCDLSQLLDENVKDIDYSLVPFFLDALALKGVEYLMNIVILHVHTDTNTGNNRVDIFSNICDSSTSPVRFSMLYLSGEHYQAHLFENRDKVVEFLGKVQFVNPDMEEIIRDLPLEL